MIAKAVHTLLDLVLGAAGFNGTTAEETLHVAREVFETIGADREAEILRRHVFQLVRFVDDRVAAGRNHFAERVLPHRRVRAQQVVIDDDDVRCRGALTHPRDEAVVVARALGTDAGFRRRGDLAPERQILGKVFEFGPIAGLGPRGPLADDRQEHVLRRRAVPLAQLVQPVQADVVRAPLHVRRGERNVQRLLQRWDVLEVDLFLEILRAGGHQHALPAQDRRHEIREGFPGPGAGLGEQDAAALEDTRHTGGHFHLSRARFVIRQRLREGAAGAEHAGSYASESGYSGNFRHSASTSSRTIASAASSSGVLSARAIRSATMSISASRSPRDVMAGVPMRTPLAVIGGVWLEGGGVFFSAVAAPPPGAPAPPPGGPPPQTA